MRKLVGTFIAILVCASVVTGAQVKHHKQKPRSKKSATAAPQRNSPKASATNLAAKKTEADKTSARSPWAATPVAQPLPTAQPHPLAVNAAATRWEDAEFSTTVSEFQKAVAAKDRAALREKIQPAFARIAARNGRYSEVARNYQTVQVPDFIRRFYHCPQVKVQAADAGDLSPGYARGQLVSAPLLDTPTQFMRCSDPQPSNLSNPGTSPKGVAMVRVVINESGQVTDVKPRVPTDGDAVFKSVAAAMRNWKATPPRWQGKPVKTAVSLDITFP